MNIDAISDFFADSESSGRSSSGLLRFKKATSEPPLYMEISIAFSISECPAKNESPLVTEIEANTFCQFSKKSENLKARTVFMDHEEHFGILSQHTFFRNFLLIFYRMTLAI